MQGCLPWLGNADKSPYLCLQTGASVWMGKVRSEQAGEAVSTWLPGQGPRVGAGGGECRVAAAQLRGFRAPCRHPFCQLCALRDFFCCDSLNTSSAVTALTLMFLLSLSCLCLSPHHTPLTAKFCADPRPKDIFFEKMMFPLKLNFRYPFQTHKCHLQEKRNILRPALPGHMSDWCSEQHHSQLAVGERSLWRDLMKA